MALLLPNLKEPLKRGRGIADKATSQAMQGMEDWAQELVTRLARLRDSDISALVLPISESDVTGLVADLAARPTGSGTSGRSTRWTGTSTLGTGAFTDDGTNVSLAGTLTLSTFTQGSVLYIGASGLVSQDNTGLYFNPTDNRLGVGLASPSVPLHVVSSASTTTSIGRLQSLNPNGNSSFDFYDEGGTNRFGIGYDNLVDRAQLSMNNSTPFVIVDNVAGQRVKFFNNGNVNIGGTTTDPGVLLYVEGDTHIFGQLLAKGENTNTTPTVLAGVELFGGRTNAGALAGSGSSKPDLAFNWGGNSGGFRHWISTWHDSVAGSAGNRMNFYLNNGTTAGSSSAPGTNNQLVLTLTGEGSGFVGAGCSTRSDNTGFSGSAVAAMEVSRDAATTTFAVSSFGTGVFPQHYFIRGRGTRAAPAAVQNNDVLGYFTGAGYGDTTVNRFGGGAGVKFIADGSTWTTSSHPGAILFDTVPTSSTNSVERMRIGQDGHVTIGLNSGVASGYRLGVYSPSNTGTAAAVIKGQYYGLHLGSEQTSSSYTLLSAAAGVTAGGGSTWINGGTTRFTAFTDGSFNIGPTNTAPSTLFRVEGTAGITSTLDVTGNFNVNTNKFSVVAASGNTTVAGTLGVTGLATLTAGFSLGADSSAASHKITNLTNGSSAQDAAAFGQIATAINAAVSGTANTIAKFTAANVVGDSSVTDNGTTVTVTGALTVTNGCTLGDTDADGHTITGFTTMVQAFGTSLAFGGPLRIADTTSMAQGVGGGVTLRGCHTGTTTTSAGLIKSAKTNGTDGNTGFDMVLAVRENGNANPVERVRLSGDPTVGATMAAPLSLTKVSSVAAFNIGDDTTSTTTGQNGVRVTAWSAGDNYIDFKTFSNGTTNLRIGSGAQAGSNTSFASIAHATGTMTWSLPHVFSSTLSVNGNCTLGDGTGDAHTINGYAGIDVAPSSDRSLHARMTGRAYGVVIEHTATGITADRNGLYSTVTGSLDATAAIRTARGVYAESLVTRSAGANVVTNYGGYFKAAGAQSNLGVYAEGTEYSLYGGAGTLYNAGALQVDGSCTLGNAASDTITAGGGVVWARGTGSPEGVVTANVGSFYSRTDGGASTSWYVKESGAGNTGWVAK